ncbi:hypothetical protein D0868_05421 [Hortaea werneckii]|uniref:Uncharacterized protein n=1 Tax=Hortaea werneckii TaxID=91943 RepID=A0A3M6YWA6_HORWE|nr:hypothetical protein D0868_05421 [Hortaea werneckii]
MAGHGPSPGGHGAHPIHIHPARPFYRFAATGLGAAMWFFVAVLQSEIRYASTAWLETPMGALRRDEALQREIPEDSSKGELQSIHRGDAKILQSPSRYDSCATDYHSLLKPINPGPSCAGIPRLWDENFAQGSSRAGGTPAKAYESI